MQGVPQAGTDFLLWPRIRVQGLVANLNAKAVPEIERPSEKT
jgi:hypothetical protein